MKFLLFGILAFISWVGGITWAVMLFLNHHGDWQGGDLFWRIFGAAAIILITQVFGVVFGAIAVGDS